MKYDVDKYEIFQSFTPEVNDYKLRNMYLDNYLSAANSKLQSNSIIMLI